MVLVFLRFPFFSHIFLLIIISVIKTIEKNPNLQERMDLHMKTYEDTFDNDYDSFQVSSATEYTGLMPTLPLDESEWESYQDLYGEPLLSAKEIEN